MHARMLCVGMSGCRLAGITYWLLLRRLEAIECSLVKGREHGQNGLERKKKKKKKKKKNPTEKGSPSLLISSPHRKGRVLTSHLGARGYPDPSRYAARSLKFDLEMEWISLPGRRPGPKVSVRHQTMLRG
ncbi:hypothetical protein LY78DRAFT_203987 [Colletotrichum sublineola]|nr:hypothetical protein LY78DRAFT_203987 [Colletotrichum sublineola]